MRCFLTVREKGSVNVSNQESGTLVSCIDSERGGVCRSLVLVPGPRPWSSSGSSTWLLVFQIISRDLLLVTVDNVLSDFILNVYFSNVTN